MKSSIKARNGGERTRFFKTNDGPAKNMRRRTARVRLLQQLASNQKRAKNGEFVSLEEQDIIRIRKELEVLEDKIK